MVDRSISCARACACADGNLLSSCRTATTVLKPMRWSDLVFHSTYSNYTGIIPTRTKRGSRTRTDELQHLIIYSVSEASEMCQKKSQPRHAASHQDHRRCWLFVSSNNLRQKSWILGGHGQCVNSRFSQHEHLSKIRSNADHYTQHHSTRVLYTMLSSRWITHTKYRARPR